MKRLPIYQVIILIFLLIGAIFVSIKFIGVLRDKERQRKALNYSLIQNYTLSATARDKILFDNMYADVLKYTNEYRADHNVAPLKENALLNEAANLKLADMQKDGYWGHVAPDGTSWKIFVSSAGYVYFYAGENLGISYYSGEELVDSWIKSPLHEENLIDYRFTEIGIAPGYRTINKTKVPVVVQLFGTPK